MPAFSGGSLNSKPIMYNCIDRRRDVREKVQQWQRIWGGGGGANILVSNHFHYPSTGDIVLKKVHLVPRPVLDSYHLSESS